MTVTASISTTNSPVTTSGNAGIVLLTADDDGTGGDLTATIDWDDGSSPASVVIGPTYPYGQSTGALHQYAAPGTYHVAVVVDTTTSVHLDLGTVDIVVTLSPGPPTNDDLVDAIVIPVDYSPANSVVTHVDLRGGVLQTGIPEVDFSAADRTDVWFKFVLPKNSTVWFNFLNPSPTYSYPNYFYYGPEFDYVLWRKDPGPDGLVPSLADRNLLNNFDGDVPMTYMSTGRFSDSSDGGWLAFSGPAGTYYLQALSNDDAQLDLELHFEDLPGPGLPPQIYLGGMPGVGGVLQTGQPAEPVQGTLFSGFFATEQWDVAYANIYLGHTDEHGLFFYAWVDPGQPVRDWGGWNDTEVRADSVSVLGDGSIATPVYTYQDLGAGADWFIDAPAPFPLDAASSGPDSRDRIRVVRPAGARLGHPAMSIVHGRTGWHIDGHDLTENDLSGIAGSARNTWLVWIDRGGDHGDYADLQQQVLELDADGNVLHTWAFGVLAVDASNDIYGICTFPDEPNLAYLTMGNSPIHVQQLNLNDGTLTDLGAWPPNARNIQPVNYHGSWCFAWSTQFRASGHWNARLFVYDRVTLALQLEIDTVRDQLILPDPTSWGFNGQEVRPLGPGQQGTRYWFRSWYPDLGQHHDPDGSGWSSFGDYLFYYDLTDDTWHGVGRVHPGFRDTNGIGGIEIQYYDLVAAASARLMSTVVVATPPLPADILDDNAAMTARVTTQARLLVSPPGAV